MGDLTPRQEGEHSWERAGLRKPLIEQEFLQSPRYLGELYV